jgi:hypothetical protein
MRKALVTLLLLGTAACGGGSQQETTQTSSENLSTFDSTEEAYAPSTAAPTSTMSRQGEPPPPPNVSPTAAPGVAFNYRYAFRLAAERIGQVQEEHAAACEKLGIAKCRITGMRYRLSGRDEIEAMLAVKLDPALARGFGNQAIEATRRAEGMLVDAEITGEDVGSRVAAARRSQGDLEDQLKQVEQQLARPGLGSRERAELQIQAQNLRDQIRGTRTTREQDEETLATTPMVFNYGSGEIVPGFDARPRLKQATEDALDNLVGGALWIAVALITLLPWAVLLALGFFIWRRFLRRWLEVTPPDPRRETPAEG